MTAAGTITANFGVLVTRWISVHQTKFGDTVANFVYSINLNSDTTFTDHSRSDGLDIVVQDSAGDTLKREIVGYTQGQPSSGQLYFTWHGSKNIHNLFKISTGSGLSYANNAGAWTDAGFVSVHHFEEASGTFADATGNSYTGTNTNGTYGITGQMGKCVGFSDAADYVSLPEVTQMNGAAHWTWSFWFKCLGDAWNSCILFDRSNIDFQLPGNVGGNVATAVCGTVTWNISIPVICTDGNYHLMTVIYDGSQSNNNYRWANWIDKISCSGSIGSALSTTIPTNHIPFTIGYAGGYSKVGNFDEFRQNIRAFSTAELNAYYDNMNAPTSFYKISGKSVALYVTSLDTNFIAQRDPDSSTITITGSIVGTDRSYPISATILDYTSHAVIVPSRTIYTATTDGGFSGTVRVPTGCFYTVAINCDSSSDTMINKIMVGDIWAGLGQSNMLGVVTLTGASRDTAHTDSAAFYDRIYTSKWHRPIDPSGFGASLAPRYVEDYVKTYHVPCGFINLGESSTSLTSTDSSISWGVHDTAYFTNHYPIYGWAYQHIVKATQGKKKIKGIYWYQGESDAGIIQDSLYTARYKNFKSWVRKDFNCSLIVNIEICRRTDGVSDTGWAEFRNMQWRIFNDATDANSIFGTTTYTLPLDDIVHVVGAGGQDSIAHQIFRATASYFSIGTFHYPHIVSMVRTAARVYTITCDTLLQANAAPTGLSMIKAWSAITIDSTRIAGAVLMIYTAQDSINEIWYAYGANPTVTAPLRAANGLPIAPWYGPATASGTGFPWALGFTGAGAVLLGYGSFWFGRRKKQ
jgi:hypothetical protein